MCALLKLFLRSKIVEYRFIHRFHSGVFALMQNLFYDCCFFDQTFAVILTSNEKIVQYRFQRVYPELRVEVIHDSIFSFIDIGSLG